LVYGEYHIEGLDIIDRSFVITKQGQGQVVATIGRKLFSFADIYGVEVAPNEDQGFILVMRILEIEQNCILLLDQLNKK
jgi:uncharacterized protein YxjI